MKGWHIGAAVIVAIVLLACWPLLGRAQALLSPWPTNSPAPTLHVRCEGVQGRVWVRVSLGGFVTGDYVVSCEAA
jgi:cytochrome b